MRDLFYDVLNLVAKAHQFLSIKGLAISRLLFQPRPSKEKRMGQKVSPIGFRLVRRKKWLSSWFANKQEFGDLISEDYKIRKALMTKPACQGASRISIKRMSGKIEVTIVTS